MINPLNAPRTIPTAIAGYEGKLIVWDEQKTLIINPESLEIEDVLHGVGCVSHATWEATDFGLFWADANYAYRLYQGQLTTISKPIENDLLVNGAIDQVVFDGEYQLVMFWSGNFCWLYWCYWYCNN